MADDRSIFDFFFSFVRDGREGPGGSVSSMCLVTILSLPENNNFDCAEEDTGAQLGGFQARGQHHAVGHVGLHAWCACVKPLSASFTCGEKLS